MNDSIKQPFSAIAPLSTAWLILVALTLWSIFTFTTGHASTLAGLLFLRFVFGLCEGPYAGSCYRA